MELKIMCAPYFEKLNEFTLLVLVLVLTLIGKGADFNFNIFYNGGADQILH